MIDLSAPNASDRRSSYADWLEFQAMMSSTHRTTLSSLFAALAIVDELEDVTSSEGTPSFDRAIAEGAKDRLAEMVLDEIAFRSQTLGSIYPFEVKHSGAYHVSLSLKTDWKAGHGSVIYVFCLLVSAIREGKFQPRDKLKALEKKIADLFQVCACLAAGGYLGGEVSSFGFPRASGSAFLPALKAVYERFGAGSVREEIEPGMPDALKDGGIDVIAWRDHPDRLPGKLYLVGQSASGRKWRDKSVTEYLEQMHGNWFTRSPQKYALPAMFIPFTAHADLDEPAEGTFKQSLKTRLLYEEPRYGMIFDRLRIAHYADRCLAMTGAQLKQVDGALLFTNILKWVKAALDATGMKKAAA